jgi:8-oxo-dGTP pyrophosphatase MutT (NUDIX family)
MREKLLRQFLVVGPAPGPSMVTVRQNARPFPVLAVEVLVWDDTGHVLMLRTNRRPDLALPGGRVGSGESPAPAGVREVAAETGLHVELGRLLVVEHVVAHGDDPTGVHLVFDSTPLGPHPSLVLREREIVETQWLLPFDAVRRHGSHDRARISAAFAARRLGATRYLDSGAVPRDRPRSSPGLSA